MLGSLLFSLSALSVSALPGLARKPRQVDASICPVPSTVTAYLPIITTIPEGQGNLAGVNTIVSQGQPFVVSSLASSTASGTSGQVFGGTTIVNNGAAPANADYTTFTTCTQQCTVAGATYTSGSVFYSTSTGIPALTTTIVGGQTLQGSTGVLTIPTAVTSTFYSTIVNGVPVTDGSQPLSTTTIGANGVPTTIIQVASQVIARPTEGPLVQTLTQITPGFLAPVTTTVYITITIGSNGLPTTPTDSAGRGAGAGPAVAVTLTPVTPTATTLPDTAPVADSGNSDPADAGAGTGPAVPNTLSASILPGNGAGGITTGTGSLSGVVTLPTALSGVTTGANGLPTPIGGNNANTNLATSATISGSGSSTGTASGSASTTTTIPCTSDADCTAAGLGACLSISGAPVLSGSLGVCGPLVSTSSNTVINSQTVAGGTATSNGLPTGTAISSVPCTSNQDCVSAGLSICLDALGATIGTNVGLATGNCATVSPIQPSSSATSSSPAASKTAVACSSSQECTGLSLGVCLDVLGNVVDLGLGLPSGTCSGVIISPSISQSLVTLPTSISLPLTLPTGLGLPTTLPVSLPVSITVPAILPTASSVVVAASDLLSSASSDAAGVSSIIASLIDQATRTPTLTGILPTSTTISCANNQQCSGLGLGLCLTVPDLLTTNLGSCALISAIGGTAPALSVGLGGSISLGLPSLSIPNVLPTIAVPLPTGVSVSIPNVLPTIALPLPTDISISIPNVLPTIALPTGLSVTIPNVLPTIALPTGLSVTIPNVLPTIALPTGLSVSVPVVLPTIAIPLPTGASLSLPVSLPSVTVIAPGTVPTSVTTACNTDADCSSKGLGLCVGVDVFGLVGAKVCVATDLLDLSNSPSATGTAATATTGVAGSGISSTNVRCQTNSDCSTHGLGVCAAVNLAGLTGVSICVDTNLLGNGGTGPTGSLPSISVALSAGVGGTGLPVSATIPITLPTGIIPVNPPTTGGTTISPALPATTSATVSCRSDADCVAHGLGLSICLGLDLLDTAVLGTCIAASLDGSGPSISIGANGGLTPVVTASVALGVGSGAGAGAASTTVATLPATTSATVSCRSDADCVAHGLGLSICLGLDLLDTAVLGTCIAASLDGSGPSISIGANGGLTPVATASVAVGAGAGAGAASTTVAALPTTTSATVSCRSDADCVAHGLGLSICLGLDLLDTAVLGTCIAASLDGSGPSISIGANGGLTPVATASVAVGAGAGAGAASTTIAALPATTSTAISCRSDADCVAHGLSICLGLNILDTAVLGTCLTANIDGSGPLISVSANGGLTPVATASVAVGVGSGAQPTTLATLTRPAVTTTAVVAPGITTAVVAPAVTTTAVVVPAITTTAVTAPAATTALPANYGKACTLLGGCGLSSGLVCIPNVGSLNGAGTCLFSS